MRQILVRKSADILLKGHGNYGFFKGTPHLITNPPPEAFNPDPNGPDVPMFAHYGNYKPHPMGHAGMGELIPGEFRRGKHGEMTYHTDGFDHHHGHDGVWHHLGEALARKGQNPALAKSLLQEAIDRYNVEHNDKSGHHHLPDVDSMEWRKIKAAPYNANMSPQNRPNRSVDGHFVTAFSNRPNRKEKIGHFLESYSVPYWKQLAEITQELGLDDISNMEWTTKGHISIDDLHPAGRRLKGRGGDVIGPRGELPDSHIKNAPGGVNFDPAFDQVQSWSVAHHMPDLMHYKLARQQTPAAETMRSARGHIKEALKRAVENPDIIPDVQVPINTAQTAGGTNYTMQPLKAVLQSEEMTKNLLNELGSTSALTGLFGRLKSGGQSRPSSGARIFSHLLDAFGGDPDEEGNRTQYDNLLQHALQGNHVPLEPEFMSPGNKHPTKNGSTHKNMAQMYVKAMLSGAHEDGTSNLRHYQPDPAELKALGVTTEGMQQENVDARRQAVNAIADMMARAFGHEERRAVPDELPEGGLAGRTVMGYPEELIPSVPEHVPFVTDLAMAPSAPSAAPRPEPAPRRPVTEALPPPPPAATPPMAPAPQPVAPQPVAVRRTGGIPVGRLTPEQQAARAGVGQADPANLREFMRLTGIGPTPGTGELTEQEQRFQQTFGDPRQRLLTEYMKSQDNMLPETDRLMKAMEQMQRDDALRNDKVMKHALTRPVNIADEQGVRHLAKHLSLTPIDVRSIAHQMGDWERIAKRLNISSDVVKVVKMSVGGI
jgi:hypothetical protein